MSIKVTGPLGLSFLARSGREHIYWVATTESASVPTSVEIRYPEGASFVALTKVAQGASYAGELGGRTGLTLIDSSWRGTLAGPDHPNGSPAAPVLTVAGKPTFRVDTGTETMIVAAGPIRLAEVSS